MVPRLRPPLESNQLPRSAAVVLQSCCSRAAPRPVADVLFSPRGAATGAVPSRGDVLPSGGGGGESLTATASAWGIADRGGKGKKGEKGEKDVTGACWSQRPRHGGTSRVAGERLRAASNQDADDARSSLAACEWGVDAKGQRIDGDTSSTATAGATLPAKPRCSI